MSHPHVVVDVRLDTAEAVQRRFLNGGVNPALFNEVRDPALQLVELYSEPLVWVMKDGGNAVAVSEVAERLGISTKSLYTWKAQCRSHRM